LGKTRVHELARELGTTSKRVMEVLEVLGIVARSHSSTLSEEEADQVRRKLRETRAGSGLITAPRQEAGRARRVGGLGGRLGELVRDRTAPPPAEEPAAPPASGRVMLRRPTEAEAAADAESALADDEAGAHEVVPPAETAAEPEVAPAAEHHAAPRIAPVEAAVVQREPGVGPPIVEDGEAEPVAQPEVDFVLPRVEPEVEAEATPEEPTTKPKQTQAVTRPPRGADGAGRRRDTPAKKGRDRKEDRDSRDARAARMRGRTRDESGQRRSHVELGATVKITDPISVRGLAEALALDTSDVLRELLTRGAPSNINASVSGATAQAIASDLGIEVEIDTSAPVIDTTRTDASAKRLGRPKRKAGEAEVPVEIVSRPPIVTVMGHVDHGKTKLLDRIRNTNVVAGESGGITQHIGASEVEHNGRTIVFLDTPGHEAFSAMRARGAQVTDLAILVVAANDGVMPQTIEAMNHAKAAGVPIIVAMNKMDLEDANPDRVLQQLSGQGLLAEEWGGEIVCVRVSALQGTGVDDLLEMILLVADMQDLKAEIGGETKAAVIEAKRDSSRGPVATVVVTQGILTSGDAVVCGVHSGKIRALISPAGKKLKKVGPGHACEIWGLEDVPDAGDEMVVVESPKVARQLAKEMQTANRSRMQMSSNVSTLAGLMEQIQAGAVTNVNLVLKADVHGSLEAITQALEGISHAEVQVKIAHSGVGSVSESDVNLASASRAIIVGFHVGTEPGVEELARDQGIDIRTYEIIYEVIDDVKAIMEGNLRPVFEEVILGKAEVRAIFKISRTGVIAGCAVLEGSMKRRESLRIFRGGQLIHESKLDSLRHVKDDVNEVERGRECGISLNNWNGFQEGDILECYTMRQVIRRLADGLQT
jgi:translation initiation factor IF-2